MRREWARTAKERGKTRVRVRREKVRGARRGIWIEWDTIADKEREWSSS